MARLSVFLVLLPLVVSIPVDNEIEGEPEIECGATSISVNFNTRNEFTGHVYVKGLYNDATCRNDETGRQVAGITLPFDTCNVQRTRSLNPRGIFVSTTVVVSFHPQFVTKVDRAYRVQCFYMEADKTVSAEIAVSELTTAFETVVVPMPVCKYEILEGGPTGTPINFALVGEQVYHKWTCDSETVDTFCMVVHSCTVDDGNGDTIQILNDEGCALDRFVLNNLEYPTDLSAGQEAHVYKYADREQLFYQCQISITIKEPNGECSRPQCTEPTGFNAVSLNPTATGASAAGPNTDEVENTPAQTQALEALAAPAAQGARRARGRRIQKREAGPGESILDVRAELSAFDMNAENALRSLLNQEKKKKTQSEMLTERMTESAGFCVSHISLSLLLSAAFFCSLFFLVIASLNFKTVIRKKLYE